MSLVQRAVGVAVGALLIFAGASFFESTYIADPDLRYPIVLLTRVLGAIVVLLLAVRVALVFTRERVRAVAPNAEQGLRAVGTVLVVTAFSAMGCAFGVSLMIEKSGTVKLWPLGIVSIFGALGAYGTSYLCRAWKMSRRSNRKV